MIFFSYLLLISTIIKDLEKYLPLLDFILLFFRRCNYVGIISFNIWFSHIILYMYYPPIKTSFTSAHIILTCIPSASILLPHYRITLHTFTFFLRMLVSVPYRNGKVGRPVPFKSIMLKSVKNKMS